MRLLLLGYNDGVLTALDGGGTEVVVLEERDLWEAKGLAAKAERHPCLAEVVFGRYQQDDQFLDVVAGLTGVDAVAPGLEYAVVAAARAAGSLGLPGAGVRAASVLRDKLTLREVTTAAGMPGPRFAEVRSADDIAAFAGGGPCVVKPSGRQASLGVLLLDAGADVGAAWAATTTADEGNQIANRPMSWRYLVEERLRGPEFSTECLVAGGRVVFLNVTAKRTSAGPAPVELGHVVPAEPPAEWRGPVDDLVRAVGFDTGILHAEWVRTADGPRLVECAGRPPGDKIVDLIDLAYRTNLTRHWVDALAGRPVDPPATASRAAAIAFVTADPGTVLAVDGVEDASALPGVERVDVLRKAGDTLADLRSSWDRVGSAIAVGDTPAEADARARAAVAAVRVEVRTER
ncbi:ATP-grasp domain-containing protein [Saccharothrix longispora]|uniref:ATP-grasp domain-containing protein n=1 Tax=Saccharothrix longispora TaxID=33920 RepID=UPI0028FD43FD|nr:ATP-grasp domain-containing protein [Saccharothrix longispora]MDU0291036.1 ATP-grasp domain-containing protein [Saccharothrix longispora]